MKNDKKECVIDMKGVYNSEKESSKAPKIVTDNTKKVKYIALVIFILPAQTIHTDRYRIMKMVFRAFIRKFFSIFSPL